jgi:hypothetical protein
LVDLRGVAKEVSTPDPPAPDSHHPVPSGNEGDEGKHDHVDYNGAGMMSMEEFNAGSGTCSSTHRRDFLVQLDWEAGKDVAAGKDDPIRGNHYAGAIEEDGNLANSPKDAGEVGDDGETDEGNANSLKDLSNPEGLFSWLVHDSHIEV